MAKAAKVVDRKLKLMVKDSTPEQYKGDLLAIALFKGTERVPSTLSNLNKQTENLLKNVFALGDFKGNANEIRTVYTNQKSLPGRILLIGLGEKDDVTYDTFRQAAGTAIRNANKLGAGKVGFMCASGAPAKFDVERLGQVIAEGAHVARYDYRDFMPVKKNDDSDVANMTMTLIVPNSEAAKIVNRGCKVGAILGQSQNMTRQLANSPGNVINPPSLASEAKKMARSKSLKCRVFTDTQLKEMGMNGILSVGQGSVNKPRLIMFEHNGRGRGKKTPDVVVVGKAITFDSGGISLKPGLNMGDMKFDKCGGCSVFGIMAAVAELKLKLNVVGLVPSAENLPSHTSYRPGDIITTYSGKTIEVQNTDAEGRLILCDALAYAAEMKPGAIIDMATLTGACVIALGEHKAGLFSNDTAVQKGLEKAAELSGDDVWHMPCGPEYLEQMKSKIADLRNIGGRGGGSSTAAAFLKEFVDDTPWAHIDIAGVSDTDNEKPYRGVGGTGFAVKLVAEYLRSL